MTKFVQFFVLILSLFALQTYGIQKQKIGYSKMQELKKLRSQKTWASFMLDLAEMNIKSGNPLGELIESIEELVTDIQVKSEKAHENFDKRTEQHESEIKRIQVLISSAQSDISSTTSYISDVLFAQKQELEQTIVSLEKNIASTRQHIADETVNRETQHSQYNDVIIETESAIETVNEALGVLEQLKQNSGAASFAQTGQFKKRMNKVQNTLKKGTERAMIEALVNITIQSKFADQSAINKVASIMEEVRANLMRANEKSTEQETEAQAAFEADIEAKTQDLIKMNNELVESQRLLQQTEVSIVDNQEFVVTRQRDLATSQDDVETENKSYQADTEIYEDLVKQFGIEQEALKAALTHLNNADIADFIGGRMEQDVMIDQPHGAGLNVESNPLQV